eukprot:SAG31_NODE_383_length_16451_cov_8.412977_8_plen_77_part_00
MLRLEARCVTSLTSHVVFLTKFCAKSPGMRDDLLAIMQLLEAEDAVLRVKYVPSKLKTIVAYLQHASKLFSASRFP